MTTTYYRRVLERDLATFEADGWKAINSEWQVSCRGLVYLMQWTGEGEPPRTEVSL